MKNRVIINRREARELKVLACITELTLECARTLAHAANCAQVRADRRRRPRAASHRESRAELRNKAWFGGSKFFAAVLLRPQCGSVALGNFVTCPSGRCMFQALKSWLGLWSPFHVIITITMYSAKTSYATKAALQEMRRCGPETGCIEIVELPPRARSDWLGAPHSRNRPHLNPASRFCPAAEQPTCSATPPQGWG